MAFSLINGIHADRSASVINVNLHKWRKENEKDPTIERLSTHLQVTQTMRGEILGTIGWMEPGHDLGETTSQFLNDLADELVPMIPALRNLNVIRQWTGICDLTTDEKPAIGQLEDGLYVWLWIPRLRDHTGSHCREASRRINNQEENGAAA